MLAASRSGAPSRSWILASGAVMPRAHPLEKGEHHDPTPSLASARAPPSRSDLASKSGTHALQRNARVALNADHAQQFCRPLPDGSRILRVSGPVPGRRGPSTGSLPHDFVHLQSVTLECAIRKRCRDTGPATAQKGRVRCGQQSIAAVREHIGTATHPFVCLQPNVSPGVMVPQAIFRTRGWPETSTERRRDAWICNGNSPYWLASAGKSLARSAPQNSCT